MQKYAVTDISASMLAGPASSEIQGLQFSNPFRKRIDIEGGRQTPLTPIDMEKSAVHQVIVHVGDQDREGDPPPEFFDIRLRLRSVLTKRIDPQWADCAWVRTWQPLVYSPFIIGWRIGYLPLAPARLCRPTCRTQGSADSDALSARACKPCSCAACRCRAHTRGGETRAPDAR
jgi:hypothetical protein